MTLLEFAILGFVILGASLVQGITGYGFAVIMVPVFLVFFEPPSAVAVATLLGLVLCVAMLIRNWGHLKLIPMLVVVAVSIPSVWLGSHLLIIFPASTVRLLAGVALMASMAPLLTKNGLPSGREHRLALAAGFVGGVLQGATGMGGPVYALFFTNQGWRPEVFRSSFSLLLSLMSVITLGELAVAGNLRTSDLVEALEFLPWVAAGLPMGLLLARRVDAKRHRLLMLALLLVTSLVLILTAGVDA